METACFETKLGWITVKKNRGNVYSLSFGKTNKTIDLINIKNHSIHYIRLHYTISFTISALFRSEQKSQQISRCRFKSISRYDPCPDDVVIVYISTSI